MSLPTYTAIVLIGSKFRAGRTYEVARFKKADMSELYDLVDSWWKAMGWARGVQVKYLDLDGNQLTTSQLVAALGSR